MNDFSKKCFVCQRPVDPATTSKNTEVNLPVCDQCKGTQSEQDALNEMNYSLSDGWFCGGM